MKPYSHKIHHYYHRQRGKEGGKGEEKVGERREDGDGRIGGEQEENRRSGKSKWRRG